MTPLGRLAFHIRFGWKRFRSARGWLTEAERALENHRFTPEEEQELTALAERYTQEYESRKPILEPRRTLLFADSSPSARCGFLNARRVRRWIVWAYRWAVRRGFTAFVVDYATPFGMLALDTLNALRKGGAVFRLYSFRGHYRPRRRSYRLIPETDVEMLLAAAQADYHFCAVEGGRIRSQAGAQCTADGIRLSQRHIPEALRAAFLRA